FAASIATLLAAASVIRDLLGDLRYIVHLRRKRRGVVVVLTKGCRATNAGSSPTGLIYSASVEIYLLGQFLVLASGARLGEGDIPGRKAAALLKLLALSPGHQIARDVAVEALWPGVEDGAAQLYKALHQLRKVIATDKPGRASSK